MSASALITLADVIGNTDRFAKDGFSFKYRGMTVACWRFRPPAGTPTHGTVIGIHGGPAFSHSYILPLQLLADHGFEVILYDQAGCGASTYVKDPVRDAPFLLTIEYYVEELFALIAHCRLSQYYLYGSSWGTVVAQEAALTLPRGLQGLLLDGALADGQLYITTQARARLPTSKSHTRNLTHL